jgi:hypothetical protein
VRLDLETGELILDLDEECDQYRPHGLCARGCGHTATEFWEVYRGAFRYEFRCHCCVIAGRLERAKWYASQVQKLEAEYEKEKESCATKQGTPTPAAPASA